MLLMGVNFKPYKVPENAQTLTCPLHALLGGVLEAHTLHFRAQLFASFTVPLK